MNRLHKLLLTTALILSGSAAMAAISTQGIIDDFSAEGYTRIEVKAGPNQTKVEAIRGTEKLEVVYDNATGNILKSEVEAVRPGEDTAPGISVRNRNRDFVRGGGSDDDNSSDDSATDDDSDDDGKGRGRGRGRGGDDSDDDSDDDRDDDRDDDNGGDDNGGGRHGGDDNGGDDNGGGRHGGDDD